MASFKDNAIGLAVVTGLGLVVFTAFQSRKIATAVGEVVSVDLNPANRGNVVNRAVQAGREAVFDTKKSPGDEIFAFFNPGKAASLCAAGETRFCTNSGSEPVKMPTGFADATQGGLRKFEGIIVN